MRNGLACLLVLLLVGCAAPAPPAASGTSPAGQPARLLLAAAASGERLELRPVDPVTLAELPDYPALPFGHHYAHVFSPDGRTLAAILWPGGADDRNGELHLIDVVAWRDQPTGVTLDDWAASLTFAPDGKTLYWLKPGTVHSAHGMPRDFALYRYVPEGGAPAPVVQLDHNFIPWRMWLNGTGELAVIAGQPTSTDNLAEGPPRVVAVDLKSGRMIGDVSLDSLQVGQRRNEETGEISYSLDHPGLAWDPDRGRLYIVHPGADRITVVDPEAGKIVADQDVQPRVGWLERLGLEARAAAKMVPGTIRQAVLSPDGTRLFITGMRAEVTLLEGDQRRYYSTGTGLQIIATDSLREAGRLDAPVSDLALSPDGRHLLLWGSEVDSATNKQRGSGIYLVDTQHPDQPSQLLPGTMCLLLGFAPDGRYAYVAESRNERMHRALDLETGRFVAEREVGPGYGAYLGVSR